MEMNSGSCRLGLWYVHVEWRGSTVYRVRFATTGIPGDVPDAIRQFCAGRPARLDSFDTPALHGDEVYPRIYREVRKIPYGSTATYGAIAQVAGTSPRVVGQAMARNAAPLIIPCHRVVAADGIGGFSPSVEIKEELLALEKKALRKLQLEKKANHENTQQVSSIRMKSHSRALNPVRGAADPGLVMRNPTEAGALRSAIILVGGEARRANGQEKYFFQYQGKTFIERLVDSLREVTDEIILVAKNKEQCRRFDAIKGVRCIRDIRPGLGPIGGLHAGVCEAKGDLIFVSACDMPCIENAIVSYLFEVIGDADAAIPSWDMEMLEPLHAVYRRPVLIEYLRNHPSLSLRSMIRSFNTKYIPVDELRRFDPMLKTFTNINKLEELDRINATDTAKTEPGTSVQVQDGPDPASQ